MKIFIYILSFFIPSVLIAQLPITPVRTIEVKTTEGTGMNVDISPDGKTLVFDLLGEIFIMPATGGKARQLTSGIAVNAKPVWSPDGSKIAFLTDQSSQQYDLRTEDTIGHLGEPMYLKIIDSFGKKLPVLKKVTPVSNEGAVGEVSWATNQELIFGKCRYSLSGKKDFLPALNFIRSISTLNTNEVHLQFIKTINKQTFWDLYKVDFNNGKRTPFFPDFNASFDSVCNIRVGASENWLTYLSGSDLGGGNHLGGRIDELIIYDKRSSTRRSIAKLNIKYPGDCRYQRYAFSKDEQYLYIGYEGKIHRINLLSGENKIIPFQVTAKIQMGSFNYNKVKLDNSDNVKARYISSAERRPDGKQIVFTAFNRIYLLDILLGVAKQINSLSFAQFNPSYSPDGRWIAFVTYDTATSMGDVWRIPVEGGGLPEKLTDISGHYIRPIWTPDGKNVIVLRSADKNYRKMGSHFIEQIEVASKSKRIITNDAGGGGPVSISLDGQRIYYSTNDAYSLFGPSPNRQTNIFPLLWSINIDGTGKKVAAIGRGDDVGRFLNLSVSPDEKFLLFEKNMATFIASFDKNSTEPSRIYDKDSAISVARILQTSLGPKWKQGGQALSWVFGDQFFEASLKTFYKEGIGKLVKKTPARKFESFSDIPLSPETQTALSASLPFYKGVGEILFQNASIITMHGEKIFAEGDLLVRNGRIAAIGESGKLKITSRTKILDCTGKTIVPGFIDAHYHDGFVTHNSYSGDAIQPLNLVDFSFGITNLRDPAGSIGLFGLNELISSGGIVGPRMFGVGAAIRNSEQVNSQEEADRIVSNFRKLGATGIKEYNRGSRLEEQWLQKAAYREKLNITHECPRLLLHYLAMAKDGTTGNEHAPNWGDVYDDVLQFYTRSKIFITPTVHAYSKGSNVLWFSGLTYFKQRLMNEPDKKMELYNVQKKVALYGTMDRPLDTSFFMEQLRVIGKLRKYGAKIVASSHSNLPGIGLHFEMEAFTMGGMSNFQALESATIVAAEALGIQDYLGSIEVGKIADIVVLDKNPLDNIQNSKSIRYVMKDGILYDGDTLDTIWPEKKRNTFLSNTKSQ